MTLGEIIEFLEKQDQSKIVASGWGEGSAHSYRGYYHELAFEPKAGVTIAEMLAEAKTAVGKTFEGYKGGDFTMSVGTDCYLASYGSCGDEIGRPYLEVLCGVGPMIERAIAEAVAAEQDRVANFLSSFWAASSLEEEDISVAVKIKVPFVPHEKTVSTILRAIRGAAK